MRFLPTRLHAVIDYLVGFIVAGLPLAFGLRGAASSSLLALGIFAILYSLLTDYELGAVRFFRIRFHLALDVAFGLAMLLTVASFDLPPVVEWLAYVFGILAIVLAAIAKIRATGTAS